MNKFYNLFTCISCSLLFSSSFVLKFTTCSLSLFLYVPEVAFLLVGSCVDSGGTAGPGFFKTPFFLPAFDLETALGGMAQSVKYVHLLRYTLY